MAGQSMESQAPRIGATIGKPKKKGTKTKGTRGAAVTTLPTSHAQEVLGAFGRMKQRGK